MNFFPEMENSLIRTNKQKIDVTMWRQNTPTHGQLYNRIFSNLAIEQLDKSRNYESQKRYLGTILNRNRFFAFICH